MNVLNNDKKRRLGSVLPLLLVPVLLISVITFFMNSSSKEKELTYYDIVEMFRNDKIDSYELNKGSFKDNTLAR